MKFSLALGALAASAVTALYIPEPAVSEDLYTIELAPGKTQRVTENEKWELYAKGTHFIDITDSQDVDTSRVRVARVAFPTGMTQQTPVKALLPKLKTDGMKTHLTKLTSFNNRYYKSTTGKQSSEWLLTAVQAVIDGAAGNSTRTVATVKPFKHTSWTQDSIIASIPGKSAKTIVVGAHMDSVNLNSRTNGRAPGADDNGSGSVTILEALRVLLSDPKVASGQFENTIEFHWYAAEEAGLLGSQAVFNSYKSSGRQVKAMLNQDMTGYIKGMEQDGMEESMGVVTDNVDKSLTTFIKSVIKTYCAIPAVDTKCGYACSDHASASRAGYPSAFVFESPMELSSEAIHGTGDTISTISFEHMLEHSKLVVGFMYELGQTASL